MKDVISIAHRRINSEQGLPESIEEFEAAIVERYKDEMSQPAIALLYGVSQGYVSKVLKKHKVKARKAVPPQLRREPNGRFTSDEPPLSNVRPRSQVPPDNE